MQKRTDKTGWFVLYVKCKQEKRINEALKRSGIESFLPLVEVIKQWSDRKKKVAIPLFTSYIFVNLKGQKDFEIVLNIRESCFFVKSGRDYAQISESEISQIKTLLSLKDVTKLERNNSTDLKPKEEYTLSYGLLKGFRCEVIGSKNRNRVKIFIKSINQNITAYIPAYYLEKEKR